MAMLKSRRNLYKNMVRNVIRKKEDDIKEQKVCSATDLSSVTEQLG